MAKYIDCDAFKAKYLCCGYLPEMSEEDFDRFPTADVAPVVRCENCRYAMWVEWAKKYSCGQVRGLLVFGDHFCAFGKREYESRPQAPLTPP